MDQFSDNLGKPAFTRSRFYFAASADVRPLVAVSACLNGERVRYDGDSRHVPAATWLAASAQLVPICPEVGAGLGVPRPPVQLVRTTAGCRALGRDDPTLDVTQPLEEFARRSSDRLRALRACGYLLKSRSPSCGFGSTPLFDADGQQVDTTSGIHAEYMQRQLPWLSFAEETALVDRPAVLAFELRCRLVFDWLHAGDATPATLHRHYRFLLDLLDDAARAQLEQHLAAADAAGCVAALQTGIARLPPGALIGLFDGRVAG